MVKNENHTISAESLVEKLFTTKMNKNDLLIYFQAMHYYRDDFHIHNNLLSKYVYEHYDEVNISPAQKNNIFWEENIHNLNQYLNTILNVAESSKENNKKNILKLIQNKEAIEELAPKMEEHIKLALLQYETFFSEIESVKEKASDLSKELESKENKLKDATKKLDNSTANFISMLGIYSALIFGVFGGFDAFKSIFSNMKNTPISIIFVDGSILMIGLITLVFILLQAIGILSGKAYLACEHNNTSECDCPFSRRYPIFSLTLKIFFGILIFGSIVHIVNKTNFLYQSNLRIVLTVIGIFLLIYLGCNIIKTTKYI